MIDWKKYVLAAILLIFMGCDRLNHDAPPDGISIGDTVIVKCYSGCEPFLGIVKAYSHGNYAFFIRGIGNAPGNSTKWTSQFFVLPYKSEWTK